MQRVVESRLVHYARRLPAYPTGCRVHDDGPRGRRAAADSAHADVAKKGGVERRCTVEYKISPSVTEVFSHANPSVIVYLLLQKVGATRGWNVDVQSASVARIQRVSTASSRLAAVVYVALHFGDAKVETRGRFDDRNNEPLDYTFKTIPQLKIIPKYVALALCFQLDLRVVNGGISPFLLFDSLFEASRAIHHREVWLRDGCDE